MGTGKARKHMEKTIAALIDDLCERNQKTVDSLAERNRTEVVILRQEIGEMLRDKRKKLKLSVTQMADKIGVHHAQIIRWETGQALPNNPAIVMALIECYRLNPQEVKRCFFVCNVSVETVNILTNTITFVIKTLDRIEHSDLDDKIHIKDILYHLKELWDAIEALLYPLYITKEVGLRLKAAIAACEQGGSAYSTNIMAMSPNEQNLTFDYPHLDFPDPDDIESFAIHIRTLWFGAYPQYFKNSNKPMLYLSGQAWFFPKKLSEKVKSELSGAASGESWQSESWLRWKQISVRNPY